MELNTLQDLLIEQLRDVYSAENQLIDALPKMAEAATNAQLKQAFETHLEETRGQAERLQRIASQMGITISGHTCKAMEGLVKEGTEMIKEDGEDEVKDAGLIAAAQRVEHYEIAAFGTARVYAKQLGLDEVYDLLSETLEEEKSTDVKLTELAVNTVNVRAEQA